VGATPADGWEVTVGGGRRTAAGAGVAAGSLRVKNRSAMSMNRAAATTAKMMLVVFRAASGEDVALAGPMEFAATGGVTEGAIVDDGDEASEAGGSVGGGSVAAAGSLATLVGVTCVAGATCVAGTDLAGCVNEAGSGGGTERGGVGVGAWDGGANASRSMASASRNANANARAEVKRSSRRFCKHCQIARSMSGGTSSRRLEIGVGSSATIFASKPGTVLSSNTGVPASNSWRIAPSAHTSARVSMLPGSRACSGDR